MGSPGPPIGSVHLHHVHPGLDGVHRVPCLRRRDRGLAYGGGTGVAKDIEVYAHYGHEGGVDYQVDWQLSWFVECLPDQG